MSTKQYSIIVFVIVICTLISFYSGYFFKGSNKDDNTITDTDNTKTVPYFKDEIILITKDKPHYTLIAQASRSFKTDALFSHRQKVFFFDGKEWQSKASNITSGKSDIEKTAVIPSWEIKDDPSFVLRQSVKGSILINNNKIEFDVPELNNEIGIRSLVDYTLFRSESRGKLVIDGKEYESYVLYSRTYSQATSISLVEVSDPLGINTDWVAFWDLNGNFYNIDKTTVDDNYKGDYKSHTIAVYKDSDEKVQKSFTVDIQKKTDNGYQIKMLEKINSYLDVYFLNTVNKNITSSPYNWKTGQIEGSIRLDNGKVIKGIGIYEQLYQ